MSGPIFGRTAWAAVAVAVIAVLAAAAWWFSLPPRPRALLLAPMVGGLDGCLLAGSAAAPAVDPRFKASCDAADGSAAALVQATLANIATGPSANPGLELGYTLNVPLLRLLVRRGDGWAVDPDAVERVARTVAAVDRPAVLYLFSTHFSVDAQAERDLASDPSNLLAGTAGPLPVDTYYGAPVYPWSFVRTDNTVSKAREDATRAVLQAVCRLPPAQQDRVRAVTLLGEVHHLFPKFEQGMGYETPYAITDYSAASVDGFRTFLQERYQTVAALNTALGSDYGSFADAAPPARDIRRDRLGRYEEHIDAYAAGTLPVGGWLHIDGMAAPQVHIYVDGLPAARAQARFGRQDVAAAYPQWRTADVGWAVALDYRGWQPGIHRIAAYAEMPAGLVAIGERRVSVMDRRQQTPRLVQQAPGPATVAAPGGIHFSLDQPADQLDVYFNPLVPVWHAFRSEQVRRYLAHFATVAQAGCIGRDRVYSHQILPFSNPGWDATRFGLEPDLGVPADVNLGVSLYGEAAYGSSFFRWLDSTRRQTYGVTEFHPLQAWDASALRSNLARHHDRGATFVSFFVNAQGAGARNSAVANPFVLDDGNPAYGSDRLLQSVREVLRTPP